MWTRGRNQDGRFSVTVWDMNNVEFFAGTFDSAAEADRIGELKNREALLPILGGYQMTEADWNDPLLAMSDDQLLSELEA